MHFQFLIEDYSGKVLIEQIMQKVQSKHPDITCDYKSFRGIGGFTQKNTVKQIKTGKLLNDLATYLPGFNKSLRGIDAAVFIVLDNDDNDTRIFRAELEAVAVAKRITIDHVFCIAVEEMEAWLLGDEKALLCAYPSAKAHVLNAYVQDSICDTWETLADAIYKGGRNNMKKQNSWRAIGQIKAEWAFNIGRYMNLRLNKSESFNAFISEIKKRLPDTPARATGA